MAASAEANQKQVKALLQKKRIQEHFLPMVLSNKNAYDVAHVVKAVLELPPEAISSPNKW